MDDLCFLHNHFSCNHIFLKLEYIQQAENNLLNQLNLLKALAALKFNSSSAHLK